MGSDELYTADTFPYEIISEAPVQKRKPGNQGTRERKVYKALICAFDIETTLLKDIGQSFMYVWQAQIGPGITVIGRTWEEFKKFRSEISSRLDKNEWLVIWVHNLSFEFQFLSDPDIYDFDTKEVFCMDSRKILKAEMSKYRLEFRCSYLHTNMSLDEFTRKMGVPDYKQSGDKFDYSKIRYPWTPLNQMEMRYIINDVKGLVEALIVEMKHDGVNLYTIPRTSTGYVRKNVKEAMRSFNRNTLRLMQPDLHILELLRLAFRGGNTHCSRLMANTTIEGPIKCVDFASSYPSWQVTREFSMTPFRKVYDHSIDYIMELTTKRHQCILMKVAFSFIRLREDDWPVPYISKSKCHNLFNASCDNGRVLAAEYLETVILGPWDLLTITEEYEYDEIIVIEAWTSRLGYLPQALRDVTLNYYKQKTELKGVKGQEIYYTKSKNLLNSIYGQSVQLPLKPTIEYVHGEYIEKEEDPETKLAQYVKKAHQTYQWGVELTAIARRELEIGIRLVYEAGKNWPLDEEGRPLPGKPYFLYCDTDSIWYKGEVDFSPFNDRQRKIARKMKAYAYDPKGNIHYMGLFEEETEKLSSEFRSLGAKKYAYRTMDGKLHITISGVNKTKGAEELEAAGGLDALEDGFVFRNSGKTEVKYYDSDTAYGDYQVGDKVIHIGKNVTILDTTYTVGLTDEYKTLLSDPTIWKRLFTDL